jgi:hypothetical protein
VQKEKYVYYRCTSHRGKCDLPRFREEDIDDRLGEPLKGLQVPPEIVSQIVATLREDQNKDPGQDQHRANPSKPGWSRAFRQSAIAWTWPTSTNLMERSGGLLDRKMSEWRVEEQQVKIAIDGLREAETGDRSLEAEQVFELANKAYYLYLTQKTAERADLPEALFELFHGRCKCHACLQISIQCDLRKSQNRKMVGTTRFELATSPTPILETTQCE